MAKNAAYLVDPDSSPVAIKIVGRASFMNVAPLKGFLKGSIGSGVVKFVVDFSECDGMDSTVLGILAGTALQLRRKKPAGSIVLCRLDARNLSSIKSLGLHRIATLDQGQQCMNLGAVQESLDGSKLDELENARMCLEAHENLVEADEGNRSKFQNVIDLMQNRVDEAR